ncbi:MAG: discoidin domain-containing protein, partial [Candidatus Omnitrophica bacterium]|nr:discoidin domain-containing protein [Candidatus Omnitrophota bacterium]
SGTDKIDLAYDSDGLDYILYPEGTKIDYSYDTTAGLNEVEYYHSSTKLRHLSWVLDGLDRVTAIRTHDLSSGSQLTSNGYTYETGSNDIATFEMYGETYTVSEPTGKDKQIEGPDSSKISYSESGTESTTYFVGNNGTSDVNLGDRTLAKDSDPCNRPYLPYQEDGDGNTTDYDYVDANDPENGKLLDKVTYPAGNQTDYTYNTNDQVERISQKRSVANGGTEDAYVQFEYDTEDRLKKVYTGTLTETELQYNGNDELYKIIDGEGRQTVLGFDSEGNLSSIGNSGDNTTFEYDEDGRRERVETPSGIGTRYKYHDPTGKLLEVYNDVASSSDYKTTFQYDNNNYGENLTAVIDAEGRKTEYEYDAWGRLTDEVLYDGHDSGSYGEEGRITYYWGASSGEYLSSINDMRNTNIRFKYYAPGVIQEKKWEKYVSPGNWSEWGKLVYAYDPDTGQLDTITPTGGDCTGCNYALDFDYNVNGQLTNKTAPNSGGTADITYGYDYISRLSNIRYPKADGSTGPLIEYTLDAANRLTNVESQSFPSNDVTFDYNQANQVDIADFNNGKLYVDYGYNSSNGRLESIDYDFTTGTDLSRDYAYNDDGLRTSSTNQDKTAVNYEYDSLNRLTEESLLGVKPSGCVELNGSQQIDIAPGGDLADSQVVFTVDLRLKLDTYPGSEAILFERGSSGSDNWFKFFIDSTGRPKLSIETDSDSETAQANDTVPLGIWTHVAVMWDEGDTKFYINGVQSGGGGIIGELLAFTGSPVVGDGLDGKLDELHIRKQVVSSFDPTVDYTAGALTLGLWHFDEGTGTLGREDDNETTRYIRVWSDDLGEASGTGIYNLNVIEIYAHNASGTNLAYGDSATGRTAHQSGQYLASNVTDGELDADASDMYAAHYDNDCCDAAEWVQVDLGVGEKIASVDIQWRDDGGLNAPNSWKLQKSDNGSSWTDVKSFTSYSYPTGYLETVSLGQNATVPSGAWTDNYGETGASSYIREYQYDKVGNRTQMRLFDQDSTGTTDVIWKMTINDLNQIENRYTGTTFSTGSNGDQRISYTYDANGNLTQAKTETHNGSTWNETLKWDYTWNVRDQLTLAMMDENGSSNNAGGVAQITMRRLLIGWDAMIEQG